MVCRGLGRAGTAAFLLGETGGEPVRVDVPFRGGDPVRVVFVVEELGLTGRGIAGTVSRRFNPAAGRIGCPNPRTGPECKPLGSSVVSIFLRCSAANFLMDTRPLMGFLAAAVTLDVEAPRSTGLDWTDVLPELTSPWRLGFAFSNALRPLRSSFAMMASALSGQILANTQYVSLMGVLTSGLGSANPFFIVFSIFSIP